MTRSVLAPGPPSARHLTQATQGNASLRAGRAESDDTEAMYLDGRRGQRIPVTLCVKAELRERQRALEHLSRAYLPDAAVASVGPEGELRASAGALRVLDLQGSLLPDWPAAARLAVELPELRVLDLRCVARVQAYELVVTALTAPLPTQPHACGAAAWAGGRAALCAAAHVGAERHGRLLASGA
jgi:hypothetical protein